MDYDEAVYQIGSHVALMVVAKDDTELLKNYNLAVLILEKIALDRTDKLREVMNNAKNPKQPH